MAEPVSADRAVILLSGGVDSTTVLAIARAEKKELYAISFDYKQRHMRELESARMVASAFDVRKHLVVEFDLRDIGGSALTSEIAVPRTAQKEEHLPAIPITYVPARNTIFLSFGLAWAEVLEAQSIYIGANAIDYSGYPDCRPEYLNAYEMMANLATKAAVEGRFTFAIQAPLIAMTKADIIKKGISLGVDYSLTWSCYDPQVSDSPSRYVPCGLCDSCRIRAAGFSAAGIKDPLLS